MTNGKIIALIAVVTAITMMITITMAITRSIGIEMTALATLIAMGII